MSVTYVLRKNRTDLNKITVDGEPIMFVDTSEKIERVLRVLEDAERVGLDTEFYGHRLGKESPFGKCKPISMQFSCRGPKVDDVAWAKRIMVPNWRDLKHIRHFKKFLGDTRQKKVLHNAKADFHPLENIGCPVRGFLADTMVECFMLNSSGDHSLKGQISLRFNKATYDYRESFRVPKLKKNGEPGKALRTPSPRELVDGSLDRFFKGGSISAFTRYAVEDPLYTLDLQDRLEADLRDTEWVGGKSLYDYYRMFEREFTEVLYDMERTGCYVDPEVAQKVYVELEKTMQTAERAFFKHCIQLGVSKKTLQQFSDECKGKNGLLGSKQKLGTLFTQHFGIKLPSTNSGQLSVKSDVLRKIKTKRHLGVVQALVTWREINEKLLGTYMKPIMGFLREDVYRSRVRTTLKQTGTVSGRLSSEAVNLQNIPTRTELGKLIRSIFCASPGCYFGDADQSQVELRVAAHQSRDETMIATIRAGLNLHARTASEVFPRVKAFAAEQMGGTFKASLVSKELLAMVKEQFAEEYGRGKTVNFLVLYGGGPGRYAQATGATREEGEKVIERFFKLYPGLKKDMRRVLQQVRANGYVRTAYLKRYAHFPDVASSNSGKRAHAERGAYNATIQGGARDLMMLAMICISRDERLKNMGVKMMLQVHDELCFDIPKDVIKKAGPIIMDYVAQPYKHLGLKELLVPTPADFKHGASWKDTH